MSRAVLSLGSNLGDRLAALRDAVAGLGPAVVATSGAYETAPWGPVPQDDFLNAVVLVDGAGTDARDWLRAAHRAERAAGRERVVRWGPRTLDVDVVTVTGHDGQPVRASGVDLVLPHPRAHQRAFVLVPWLAVDPDAVLPGRGRVADLVAALDPAVVAGVRPRADLPLEEVQR